MTKETYIYGDIWDYSSLEYIKAMDEAKGMSVVTRVNTPGGEPSYAWGMVTKFNEHDGPKTIIIDGKAQSSGFLFVGSAKADKVIAIKEAIFLLHRAAYAPRIERDPTLFTESMRQNLVMINDGFRKAMEAKIDVKKLEKISGVTMDQVFSLDSRIDVNLTAKQALEIGLIDEIRDITPKEKAEVDARYEVAALSERSEYKQEPKQAKQMTIDALKAEHPDLFNQVFNAGVSKERDRVGAWATYTEADPEAVTAGIKNGSELSLTAMAELNMKMFKATQTKALVAESPVAVATAAVETPVAEADKKVEAFYKELIS
jgi:ATP-dependent protease ClpP protease subunit